MSRYDVVLNNVHMASIDSSIVLHDVQYETPNYNRNLFQIANRQGARTGKTHKDRAAVRITFEIREYDTADRQEVLSKIINWAKLGGDLRINDRPGQRLLCVLDEYPSINSVLKWTEELSLTFAAYDVPYWQGVELHTISDHYSGSGSTVKRDTYKAFTFDVPGNAPFAYVDSIFMRNWTTSSSLDGQIYFDIQNVSRDDGLFAVLTIPLHGQITGEFELSYDERQIQTLVCRHGTTEEYLQNRHSSISETFDIMLTCGIANTVEMSMTTRAYVSGSAVYTPLECDMEINWRGYWE